jgi:hypothetical protein
VEISPPPDPQGDGLVHFLLFVCNGLLTALVALGAYIVNLYRHKVDGLEKSHAAMTVAQKHCITRDELDAKFQEMQDDRRRMHEENLANNRRMHDENVGNMREIRSAIADGQKETGNDIRSLHQRIDDSLRGKRE